MLLTTLQVYQKKGGKGTINLGSWNEHLYYTLLCVCFMITQINFVGKKGYILFKVIHESRQVRNISRILKKKCNSLKKDDQRTIRNML